uniref:M48 family metallopeptidase n=1 Tax=Ferrovibrio sp. TaxID=1917215 RepID=UPI00311FC8CD
VCETAAGQAALQRLVARLSQPPPRLPLQVRVIRHGMINAFALPGGYIVLTEGLLRFVGSDGELAGVIAHEIGHVDAGHAMAAAIRSGATGLLVGLLFGDVVGGIGSVTVAEHLLHAAYTRDLEDEADHLALQRLRQSGIDPAGMAAFFRRLAGKAGEGMPALLSTHPDTAIRAARFAAAAQPASPLLAPAEWQALKDICRG